MLSSFWHGCIGVPHCLLCHGNADHSGLCRACWADLCALKRDGAELCPRCTSFSMNAAVCAQCLHKRRTIAALYASYRYTAPLQQLLRAFKHQRQLTIVDTLAALMLAQPPVWLPQANIDGVLAMPLSRNRLFERGFNQSQLLAAAIARHYGLPLIPIHWIHRHHRPPQSTLNGKKRRDNVRGVFQVRNSLNNRNLLLIDDVVTTGATITELAHTLKFCGVAQLYAWALAHPK
jgi:ComF family protein